MSDSDKEFADRESAERLVARLYPEAEQVVWVEHGYDNLVALVDSKVAVRFPRKAEALARSQYEAGILKLLEGFDGLAIPQVIEAGMNPAYLTVSFLPGGHCTNQEIRAWSTEQQLAFGRSVGRFAFAMHSLDIVDDVARLKQELGIDELGDGPWDVYLQNQFADKQFPIAEQEELVTEYYTKWQALKHSEKVFVHDDLHANNMMFDQQKLIGVLDFGDAGVGSREQELRQLYRINEAVLNAAVEEYQRLWGGRLNVEEIKMWAIVQEMAVYAEFMNAAEKHGAYARAVGNLSRWLPEGKWGAAVAPK